MRKYLVSILCVGILASFSTPSAIASIKTGASCTPLGRVSVQNGRSYTCVKSGKKLIWNTGIQVSTTKSPQSATTQEPNSRSQNTLIKSEGSSCTPDTTLAPQLQWFPGKTLDSKKTFLMCNPESNLWSRIHISGNRLVSFEFEEPSLTEVLTGATFRLNNPSSWDSISSYMEKITASIQVKNSTNEIGITIITEPGDNGSYAETMKTELAGAINFYSASGFMPKYRNVFLILGRSQKWMTEQVATTCHPGWSGTVFAGISVGTCEIGESRGEFVLNVPGIVTGYGTNFDPAIALSKITHTLTQDISVRLNVAHEFFHLFQFSAADPYSNWYQKVPLWFTEGSPQVMGLLSMASNGKLSNSYLQLLKESNPAVISAPGECTRASMRDMDSTPGAGCQYSLGIFAIETLIANHGGIDVIRNLITNYRGGNFSTEFQQITGTSLESFYDEVDVHAKTFGYELN